MTVFHFYLASSFVLSMVGAVDVLVKKDYMICDNRNVKASLSYVCNTESLCTLGKSQAIGGSFIYDGLENYQNATNEDSFFMDAKIRLNLGGVTTFEHVLADMAQVPVCGVVTANDYNLYGDCPADGRYSFSTQYYIPAPSSDFLSWASTGYDGDIILDIYLHSNLVGRCVVGATTMVTGSYNKKAFQSKPSGEIIAIVVLLCTAIAITYLTWVCCMPYWSRRTRKQCRDPQEELDTNYNRMESPAIDKASTRPVIESRSFTEGPLI